MGVFSVSANAEEVDTYPYYIHVEGSFSTNNSTKNFNSFDMRWGDGVANEYNWQTGQYYPFNNYSRAMFNLSFAIIKEDSSVIVEGGRPVTFKLDNCFILSEYKSDGGSVAGSTLQTYAYGATTVALLVEYIDGSQKMYDGVVRNNNTGCNLEVSLTPEQDVRKISFIVGVNYKLLFDIDVISRGTWGMATLSIGEPADGEYFHFHIDRSTEEAGLLDSILDKVTSGFSSVVDKLTSGFSGVVDAITNLPAKIWEFIENGLKSLFVPDDEYIVSYKDKWDTLLSEKLGAVYQVVNITIESWEQISSADETNTIAMPSVSIPLPDDNEFTFGGSDVQIVPTGFEALATSVKLVTGVACTILFVNGLRKRYDEFMGAEE